MKKESNIKRGKSARAAGVRFELKVRKNLEEKGWIVAKWQNNVNLTLNKCEPAKRKYNPFSKALSVGTGFPDFICFKQLITEAQNEEHNFVLGYEVIGVEVKSNGYLDKEEKAKCKWLLDKNIFSKIIISSKGKKRGEIVYKEFE